MANFALQSMVETTLLDGLLVKWYIANFGIFLDIFEFLRFEFFPPVFGYYWSTLLCIVEVLQRGGSVAVAVLLMTCDR